MVTSSSSRTVPWTRVAAWRAERHHLAERVPRRHRLAVVSELCGLHAQVMSSAALSLWARVDDLRPDDVATSLWKDRSLVKMWAMRGTLHLLPAAEHPLWQAALSPYAQFHSAAWARYFGVTSAQIDRLIGTIAEALDGRLLTREELADEVARQRWSERFGVALRESWGGILKPPSYRGVLCFAPGDGQRVRFTNPRSWLGVDGSGPDPDQALTELVRRFLAAYAPVSREELSRWWSRISAARAEEGIRSLGDEIVQLDVEGLEAWALAADADAIATAEPSRSVRLLPAFDQYVVGATKHSANLMPDGVRDRVHRVAGWVSPVLAVDGRIEGVWRHERSARGVQVTIEPFRRQPAWVRTRAGAEAERLAAFLGGSLSLAWAM